MINPSTSGLVQRYLLDGKHAEQYAQLEIEENTLTGAMNVETGEQIPTEEVGRQDIEKAIEFLQHYGN